MRNVLLLGLIGMASAEFAPDNAKLKAAVDLCINEEASGLCTDLAATAVPNGHGVGTYGAIGDWDVSKVTSFHKLFEDKVAFNQPIGDWDTSSVSTLEDTFYSARKFNQPIGDWDTSKVTTLDLAFFDASTFNQPIGDWDTSKVTTLSYTFYAANAFNQPIGDWDVSSARDLGFTFYSARKFNQPIGDWDVSSVWNLDYTFHLASAFNQDLSMWVTTRDTSTTFTGSAVCDEVQSGKCNCAGGERDESGRCNCVEDELDECGVCRGPGFPTGKCDCEGTPPDECGVCGGPGFPTGTCDCEGTTTMPEGKCDCEGNELDACGVCGGSGICDTTIKMYDSFGDGWDGFVLTAYTTDNLNGVEFTLESGSYGEQTISNLLGLEVTDDGDYPSEVSYTFIRQGDEMTGSTVAGAVHDLCGYLGRGVRCWTIWTICDGYGFPAGKCDCDGGTACLASENGTLILPNKESLITAYRASECV